MKGQMASDTSSTRTGMWPSAHRNRSSDYGGPLVGCRNRLLHLRARLRARLALHRGHQCHSREAARNASRRPDLRATVAVRPDGQRQGDLLDAGMRLRHRAGGCLDAGRSRHHPARRVIPQRSRHPCGQRNARPAGTGRRPDRRRHSAARVRRRRLSRHLLHRSRQLHVGLDLRRLPACPPRALAAAGDSRRLRQGVDGAAAADVGRVRELLQRQGHSVYRTARVSVP